MAVVSSCREMFGYVRQRAQPTSLVASRLAGHSKETARDKREEGVDDVKSSCPLRVGLHTCYNGGDNGLIPKKPSQFGLGSATRPHEVGIASNRVTA